MNEADAGIAARTRAYSRLVLAVAVSLVSGSIRAYEVASHAEMTYQAARSSIIKEQNEAERKSFLRKLGFVDERDLTGLSPPWRTFFEFVGQQIEERSAKSYDDAIAERVRKGPVLNSVESISPLTQWLMRGSIREDDVGYAFLGTPVDGSNDEGLIRVFNHFLDPQNDRGLTILGVCPAGIGACKRSADWALGVVDFRAASPQIDTQTKNRYSYAQAKEALWRAMTGRRSSDGGDVFPPGGQLNQTARYANLATAFRSLGSVIHHVQDMAQPQHVRNDRHSGLLCYGTENPLCLSGHSSVFEKYIEARTLATTTWELDMHTFTIGEQAPPANPLPVSAPTTLARSQDHWSTAAGSGSLSGTGLADFTSRSFYSAGTNIRSFAAMPFSSPTWDGNGLGLESRQQVFDFVGESITADVQFRTKPLDHPVLGSPLLGRPARLTAEGAFDQFLTATGGQAQYSLIPDVYRDQADVLLPLAVSYAAGLIDYFFRGEVEIYPPTEGVYAVENFSTCPSPCGFSRVKAQLRNANPATDTRSTIGAGKLVAVVKYRLNTCYQSDLSGEPGTPNFAGASCRSAETYIKRSNELITGPGQLPLIPPKEAASPQEYTFTFADPIPFNASDAVLQIAFRGELGAETDGVLVSSRDIAEPSFLRLVNTTDWEFNLDGTLRGAASPGAQINLTELTVTFLLPQNSIPNQTEKVAAHAINLTPRKEGVIAFLPGSEYPGFKVAILSASGGGTPFPFNWQPGIPFWFYRPNDSETAYGRNPSVIKIRDKWGQATFSWVGGPMGQVWDPGMCIAEATRNLPGCVQGPPVNALDGVASWTIPFND